jgi:hypothetical protein
MSRSKYLSSLSAEQRKDLEHRLHSQQSGRCFICDEAIDLTLQAGQLDIDHIDPLIEDGLDAEENFALTHSSCNRSKGASDLRVARRIAEFEKLQERAKGDGRRGANLADVLKQHNGARKLLRIKRVDDAVEYSLSEIGDNRIYRQPLYRDKLSDMSYFFTLLPISFLHHDDKINPRSIGPQVRALVEEFLKKFPQLHVALAWWAPEADGAGPVKVFDGQHKAAAQILLGVEALPVRIFLNPNVDQLRTANTHAGSNLRQVAFDPAVMRHLGSTLYADRVRKYKQIRSLAPDDYSFSEADLVRFFRGEKREMERYIIDAQRDAVTHSQDNRLLEFVEWSGKAANRPLAYSTVERTFFKEFLFKKALETSIDEGMDRGANPRVLERDQLIKLMNLFANTIFVGKWDPELGGRRLEEQIRDGKSVPEHHLRAWRIAREEVLANVMRWIRLVLENYFAWSEKAVDNGKLLHVPLADEVWKRVENFLLNLSKLPCWFDKGFSSTVFGPKQNLDYWKRVFETGTAPNGVKVLARPLVISQMIQSAKS